jgi:hypothetical protein
MAALAGGCTLDLPGTDAGASDAAVEAATQTVGDQCTAIATEFCSQLPRCNIGGSVADCIASYTPQCCAGSVCNGTSKSPPSAIDGCKTSIDQADCNAIVNSQLPPACAGLPQKP